MSYSVHHLPLQHILELRPDLIGRLSLERVRQTREGVAVAAARGKTKSDFDRAVHRGTRKKRRTRQAEGTFPCCTTPVASGRLPVRVKMASHIALVGRTRRRLGRGFLVAWVTYRLVVRTLLQRFSRNVVLALLLGFVVRRVVDSTGRNVHVSICKVMSREAEGQSSNSLLRSVKGSTDPLSA